MTTLDKYRELEQQMHALHSQMREEIMKYQREDGRFEYNDKECWVSQASYIEDTDVLYFPGGDDPEFPYNGIPVPDWIEAVWEFLFTDGYITIG